MIHQRLHRFLPPLNGPDLGQRLRKPIAQPARAHGRDGAIERAVERCISRRIRVQRFQNLQVPQRRKIERQVVTALIKGNARQAGRIAPQMLRQVMQHGARRANRRRPILQAEPVQRGNLEMLAHGEQSRLRREDPAIVSVQYPAKSRRGDIRVSHPFRAGTAGFRRRSRRPRQP